jgi:uncharacterized protein (TIRG00374 family)
MLSRRTTTGDNARPEEDRLRNALRLIAGIAVSLACLWLATRGTDWAAVGAVLRTANLFWWFAGVAGGVCAIALRAVRWRILLRPLGVVPFAPAFSATAIGFGATAVLPLRIGEIVRPALLARSTGLGLSPTLSSVVLERLFDMLFVVLCFLLLSVVYPVPATMRQGAIVLAAVAVGGFAVLVVAERQRAATERLVASVLRWLPGRAADVLRPVIDGFLQGLSGVADVATVGRVAVYSAYLWGMNGLPFVFALLALDIDAPLLPAGLATLVIVAAAVFLPQGPGFVGTWQLGCVTALGLFGVPREQAVGFSLLTWLLQMVVSVGTGAVCLAREDLSVRQLLSRTTAAEPEESPRRAGAEG